MCPWFPQELIWAKRFSVLTKNPAKTETLLHQKTLKYQILKLATVDIKADATVETKVQGSTKCWNKSSRFQKNVETKAQGSKKAETEVHEKVGVELPGSKKRLDQTLTKHQKTFQKTFKNYIKKHQKTSTNIDKTSTKHQKTSAKHRLEPRHKPSVVFLLDIQNVIYLRLCLPRVHIALQFIHLRYP